MTQDIKHQQWDVRSLLQFLDLLAQWVNKIAVTSSDLWWHLLDISMHLWLQPGIIIFLHLICSSMSPSSTKSLYVSSSTSALTLLRAAIKRSAKMKLPPLNISFWLGDNRVGNSERSSVVFLKPFCYPPRKIHTRDIPHDCYLKEWSLQFYCIWHSLRCYGKPVSFEDWPQKGPCTVTGDRCWPTPLELIRLV